MRNPNEAETGETQNDLLDMLASSRGDLWGYLLNHVRNRSDAEDLFQEVNLKVIQNLTSLREASRFRSWMFSIAMNTVRSFFRKQKPEQTIFEETPESLSDPAAKSLSPLAQLEHQERVSQLRSCLQQLPERDREILLLDFIGELPQQEIADQM